jgi:hypothetical protein
MNEASSLSGQEKSKMRMRFLACVLCGANALACSNDEAYPQAPVVGQGGSAGHGGQSAGTGGTAGSAGSGGTPSGGGGAQAAGGGGNGGAAGTTSGGSAGASGSGGSGGAPDDGWVPLFNGVDLDGWMVHEPDKADLYAVENGEIHVYPTQLDQSDQPQACLRNLTSLGPKYTLHVEYKWGEARFSDRKQTARDAGILFHITGDVNKVWQDSIECQLGSSALNGDWVTGDLWVLGNPTYAQTKDENGDLQTYGGGYGFSPASQQADLPQGEWNTVEVIIDGADEAVYMVNGVEVNRVFNMTYDDQPLSEGYVCVQAEFAELFYRNIKYKLNE